MKLYPASLRDLYIEWKLEGESFEISRSTSPTSDFRVIASNLEQPFYIDRLLNLHDNNVRYYYRVVGYSGGQKVSEDGPGTLEYNVGDGVANKVIEEGKTVLKVMNNPPVFFLLKRRVGMVCPECWNPITKKVRFSNCYVCNGTGVVEGYHQPIVTRISQDISQFTMGSGEMDNDKVQLTPIRAWISNTPLLLPEDIMVDVLNQRYKVVNVSRRTRSQYVIRQVLELIPLEKGHPSYKVEVDRKVKPT